MAAKKAQHSARAAIQKQQPMKSRMKRKNVAESSIKAKKALVTQEIKLARLLASNDRKVRDKILKYLKKWLTARARSSFAFTEADFMRLWKGLFYCMWMSDKPLIQEELAESLSKLVHCFGTKSVILLYTKCALKTLGTEWLGIDQYRLDKFAMLTRRIIRQTFQIIKDKSSWSMDWVKGFSEIIQELILDSKTCLGFSMHITELFLEELAKISAGNLPKEAVTELVKPFTEQLIGLDDERQIKHIMKHIFRYLIFQSDVGLEYSEKFTAWKDAGFPTGHIDAMEKLELPDESGHMGDDSIENDEQEELNNVDKPLDPRAGRVDVELPQIPFDPKQIADVLTQYKFHPSSKAKSRRQLLHLIKEFTELSDGKMPLGMKEVLVPDKKRGKNNTKAAALRLLEFENELHSDNAPNKRKRRRGKKGLEDNDLQEESSESSSEDENEMESDNEDVVDPEEEEPIQKIKKKKNTSTLNGHKSGNSDLPESSKAARKKKRKIIESSDEASAQTVNYEKKVPPGPQHIRKKIKPRQESFAVPSFPDTTPPPIKKKKHIAAKVCGAWDVSENIIIPSPTSNVKKATLGSSSAKDQTAKPRLEKLTKKAKSAEAKLVSEPGSKKRVKIVLHKNTAQHTSEYMQQLRQSPGIPFDAEKKPLAGVLKASPIPSPINPFYKRVFK